MLSRLAVAALLTLSLGASAAADPLRIEAVIAPGAAPSGPLTGRLLVAISKDGGDDPRLQIKESYDSQQLFGEDVNGSVARTFVMDAAANGYPVEQLKDLPAGDYTVQAVFNVYDHFHRADGHTIDLPADHGEGQQWKEKPGNPYSSPIKLHLSPDGGAVRLILDKNFPAAKPADPDTPWLKHVHMKDDRLSKFWGRDVFLDAFVLLPQGWAEHPDAHYPVVVYQSHFSSSFRAMGSWSEAPPAAGLKDHDLEQARAAYAHYQQWTAGLLPHVILVQVNHANPFYDDSYAVNSANVGPYGDAINLDLIPEIERRFRGLGAGWARATYGGSTGGWEALATQVLYPDTYNGAWGLCPDPVDFHAYQAANLYDDENAYSRRGPFGSIDIVSDRAGDSEVNATMRGVNRYESAIGSHGRSAEQYDAWQAVFSPVGPDGYPARVYDKATGKIDKAVVAYWRDHYDLNFILKRDWPTLGPKLEGKLHVAVGDSDTYYLNNAVHMLETALKGTRAPHSDATFDYGSRAPHCYTGAEPDWARGLGVSAIERFLPDMAAHMVSSAPSGSDVKSWRY
jgi:hypothetical protein